MTLIEKVVLAAIVGVVLLIVTGASLGGFDLNDPKTLCMFRGGVPIVAADGRLTSCDFPVNIGSRW